jgi:hypothetical protein
MICKAYVLFHEMNNQKRIHRINPEKWHDGDFFCKILYKRFGMPLCSGQA